MFRRLLIVVGLVLAAASCILPAHAVDTTRVGQAAVTTTTRAFGATTSTTAVVLPTTVADTGVFSLPVFAAGILLVGIGLSLKGKRPEGEYFT